MVYFVLELKRSNCVDKILTPIDHERVATQNAREALMAEMTQTQACRIVNCAVNEKWNVMTVPVWFSIAVAALENILDLDERRGIECARALFASANRGDPLQQIVATDRLLSALTHDEADHC